MRTCIPIVSTLLADHMENVSIHGTKTNGCHVCVVAPSQLGIIPKPAYDVRDHAHCQRLFQAVDIDRYVRCEARLCNVRTHSGYLLMCRRLGTVGVKPIANAQWTLQGISPPLIVRVDILHNILLGVMKHVREWTEGFLQKHKRLGVFDKIWQSIPPYTGYRPPQTRYRQVTMWSGVEMTGVNRVLLACFTAALRQTMDAGSLSAAAQGDPKIAIRCILGITDFCLMAQYCSHIPQTIVYVKKYLQEFLQFVHIFREFRATKVDREEATKAAKELAEGQARQATIEQYFTRTAMERGKLSSVARQERQQLVHDILQQGTCNFPKLHLLTHYGVQIQDFGRLPQYSTEITEALHEPLKDAYRRSNRVDATQQILDTISSDYAIRMRELHLLAWSREIKVPQGIVEVIHEPARHGEEPKMGGQRGIRRPMLVGQQSKSSSGGIPLCKLETELYIPGLVERFRDYVELNKTNRGPVPDIEMISRYMAHYYNIVAVPVKQFQGDSEIVHKVRWTGKRGFRRWSMPRADGVWVRQRERAPEGGKAGELNGQMVVRLEGLFRVCGEMVSIHEVALRMLLRLPASARP